MILGAADSNPGAADVGSLALQFAKVAGRHVIVCASQEQSRIYKELGADQVIDLNHMEPWKPQLEKLGIDNVNLIYAKDCEADAEELSQITFAEGELGFAGPQ